MEKKVTSASLRTAGSSFLVACLLASVGCAAPPGDSERTDDVQQTPRISEAGDLGIRQLSPREMHTTRGGISTSWMSAPQQSSDDNIPFTVAFQNISSSSYLYGIYGNNTKVASRIVAGNEQGTWSTRTDWPTTGSYFPETRYTYSSCGDGSSCWVNSYTHGTTTRVDPAVPMFHVRVWNTTVGGVNSSVTTSQVRNLLDLNSAPFPYDWTSDVSVDAVYGQCATASGGRMQFRYTAMPRLNLADCTNPLPIDPVNGVSPRFGLTEDCVVEVFNETTANGTDIDEIHLVVFPDIFGGVRGFHFRGEDVDEPDWYVIGVDEVIFANPLGAMRTIAHELGHWVLTPQSPSHSAGCTLSCNTNNDLMCNNTMQNCGTFVPAAQCTNAGNSIPFYYPDVN